eukprot:3011001-Amphidinium_carterae.1
MQVNQVDGCALQYVVLLWLHGGLKYTLLALYMHAIGPKIWQVQKGSELAVAQSAARNPQALDVRTFL